MILGIACMDNNNDFVEEVKHLDKKRQIELLRSLLQQLEPDVVQEAAEDAVVQINLGSNNTNGSTVTYSDLVINLYCNETDINILSGLLDAAAHRLKYSNKVNHRPTENL